MPEGRHDLLIGEGVLQAIGQNLPTPEGTELIAGDNLHISAGWVDVGVQACDPGYEHREDLNAVVQAAAAGGYVAIATFPNTHPAIHSKSEVLYVRNKTAAAPTKVYPIGAVSVDCAGKDLAELYDMHKAGAIAFSDGSQPVQDASLLLRALQYAKAFDGLIINQPHHRTLAGGGQMHEGLTSTMLGLKGLPALAEEIAVQRDLSLLEYAEGRLHLHLISTRKSVAMVRAAKAAGLPVTCSVAVANLCFTDEKLIDFDAHWKVLPPLRSQSDAEALTEGVLDGTIDLICSNHAPWDVESKNLEFTYADFGMIGLETAFSLYATHLADRIPLSKWIDCCAIRPRKLLGLPMPTLAVGQPVELTLFDPAAEWTLTPADLRSRSANTPLLGAVLRGRALRTTRSL